MFTPMPSAATLRVFTALLVSCALALCQLLSGSQFVESAMERAQYYAGTCLPSDTDCSIEGGSVNLGQSPAHTLNLAVHLFGVPPAQQFVAACDAVPSWVAVVKVLAGAGTVREVYHPPKA